jgi:molecular chaperone Hsp33
VGGAVGRGSLAVVRYHPSWREPYSGIVPLQSGEIAEDIAHYLEASEQTASALALGVFVAADGDVELAGGYLVQALPGADENALGVIERNVHALASPTELLRAGLGPRQILEGVLGELGSKEIDRSEPRFFCACSRDRIRQAVVLLGRAEMGEIARERETLEVRCEFCATLYSLDPDEVGALLQDA